MGGFDIYQDTKTGECELIVYWGKIKRYLSSLRQKRKKFKSYADCYDYAMEKMRDKSSKGYVRVENHIYTKYSTGEIELSDLVKEIEKQSKE